MSFTIKPAKREDTYLLVSFAGPSGSGKTYSAMELATGICGGDEFLVIDTESRRGLHYADLFNFQHMDFAPPHSPLKYEDAIKAGINAGYKCIVIDSISHEYEFISQMAAESKSTGPGAWKEAKEAHKRLVRYILQARTNLIFCARAVDKIDMSKKDSRGKMVVEHKGWVPLTEKSWMFEMTLSLTFGSTNPGAVDLSLPHKLQDQHRAYIVPGQHVSQDAGKGLGAWASGKEENGITMEDKRLWDKARQYSEEGKKQMIEWASSLNDADKEKLKPIKDELIAIAKKADERNKEMQFDEE